jgi:hypothetical protein
MNGFSPPKIQHYELVVRFLVQHEDPEVGSVLQELTTRTFASKKKFEKSGMQKWENLQLKKMWSLQPFRRIQVDITLRTSREAFKRNAVSFHSLRAKRGNIFQENPVVGFTKSQSSFPTDLRFAAG